MAAHLLILADDFTGALDTGVRLAAAGVATLVSLPRKGGGPVPPCGDPVLVLDTESRHADPDTAARVVRDLVRSAREEGTAFFYKKTDSTLRGNVGAELAAMLSASGAHRLFFVPALPAAGRTTAGGIALLDGIPLHRTSFAGDPLDPVTESSVPRIIGRQTASAVAVVPRGSAIPPQAGSGRGILVFDAETDADLEEIGGRIRSAGDCRATAGCSGFASVLPWLLDLPRAAVPAARLAPPVLVVCGSLHEASLRQIRLAESRGVASWPLAGAGPHMARDVAESLARRGAAIVKTADAGDAPTGRRTSGAPPDLAVAQAVGALVRDVMGRTFPSTLVLFGGDTAHGVVDALGIGSFRPVREFAQGVAVSHADHAGRRLHLVTKAGGFGGPDLLSQILESAGKET